MTLREIVVGIFTDLGEPSDLQIYTFGTTTIDPDLAGWQTLVDMVNQSQLELVSWKFPNGRQLRMRLSEGFTPFKTKQESGVAVTFSGSILALSGLTAGTNVYKGRLAVGATSGASGLVINSISATGITTCYLLKVTGTFVAGETVNFYKREYNWNPVTGTINPETQEGIPYIADEGVPLEIISVTSVDSTSDLDTNFKFDHKAIIENTVSVPTSFVKIPQGIRLDMWPEGGIEYLVRYMRGPRRLAYTDLDVEPEIPPQFHKALKLMGLWWGYRRMQESTDAYSVKRDLDDFLLRARTEYDFQDELAQGQIKFYPDGRT